MSKSSRPSIASLTAARSRGIVDAWDPISWLTSTGVLDILVESLVPAMAKDEFYSSADQVASTRTSHAGASSVLDGMHARNGAHPAP